MEIMNGPEAQAAARKLTDAFAAGDFDAYFECDSSGQAVQLAGTGAVFSHDVRTVVEVAGARDVLHERESIIFPRSVDGRILAIHEHLSPASVSAKAAS